MYLQQNYSQDENNKWILGIGVNAIDFFPTNAEGTGNDGGFFNQISNSRDHWNISGPQIMATRHMVKNLSVDGLLSFNNIEKYGDVSIEGGNYIGIDINFRYSFMDTPKDFTIFVLAGGGYTSFNPGSVSIGGEFFDLGSGGTLNGGLGLNYWISNALGLHTQALYKHGSSGFKLSPHFYYSLSLVFNFNFYSNFTWRDGV